MYYLSIKYYKANSRVGFQKISHWSIFLILQISPIHFSSEIMQLKYSLCIEQMILFVKAS